MEGKCCSNCTCGPDCLKSACQCTCACDSCCCMTNNSCNHC